MTWSSFPVPVVVTVAILGAAFAIIRYFIRPRPTTIPVADLALWRKADAHGLSRRLRERIAVAVQALAMICLAVVLGQPQCSEPPPEPLALGVGVVLDRVHVIDASASMGAQEAAGLRMDIVRGRIREIARDLRPGERVALVLAGAEPVTLVPPTDDADRLRLAIGELHPTGGRGELEQAIAHARQLEDLRLSRYRIHVHTDSPKADRIPDAPDLIMEPVGGPLANVAIEEFGVTTSRGLPAQHRAWVRIANHSASYASFLLSIEDETHVIGRERIRLRPWSVGERSYQFEPRSNPRIEAHIRELTLGEEHDALPLDDVAWAQLDPLRTPRIVLVTSGNRYLVAALKALPSVRLEVMTPSDYRSSRAAGADLLIFDGIAPPDRPRTNTMWFAPEGTDLPAPTLGRIERPQFSAWDLGHPVLEGVALAGLEVQWADVYSVAPTDDILVSGPDGVVCFARRGTGGVREVVWGFDVARSDFPLRLAFPRLMLNVVNWVRVPSGGKGSTQIVLADGAPIEFSGQASIEGGDFQFDFDAGDGLRTLDLPAPGWWQVRAQGVGDRQQESLILSRWVHPEDTDLSKVPMSRGDPGLRPPSAPHDQTDRSKRPDLPAWQWVLLFGIVLIPIETLLETR